MDSLVGTSGPEVCVFHEKIRYDSSSPRGKKSRGRTSVGPPGDLGGLEGDVTTTKDLWGGRDEVQLAAARRRGNVKFGVAVV